MSRFSVILPSIGRDTLKASLKSCDSLFVDEILVSPDGRQAYEACEQIISEVVLGFPAICLLDPIDESRLNLSGHPQRNRAMLCASAPWLAFIDDDDVFVEGAFSQIISNLDACVPYLFRMRCHNGNEAGRTLWDTPELRECNLGTPCIVVPNKALGWWDGRPAGDYRFMAETCELQGEPVFVDTVIAEVKTVNKTVVDEFTREFYKADLQMDMRWRGRQLVKNPCDLWAMIEILAECKPDLIVETGTFEGGAAHFYAEMTEMLYGRADVISIDVHHGEGFDYPKHPRLYLILGRSSTDPYITENLKAQAEGHERTMVILDSDHSERHVLEELGLYAPLVSVGQYLIVEDTNPIAYQTMDGVKAYLGASAKEAVEAWNPAKHGFEVDLTRERFGLTFHPGGWLRRVHPPEGA